MLFQKPPSPEDCPICMRMLLTRDHKYFWCCGKTVCRGFMVQLHKYQYDICPYSRTPVGNNEEKFSKLQSRADEGDITIGFIGLRYEKGDQGIEQNMEMAIKMISRAVCLGRPVLHYRLGVIIIITCNNQQFWEMQEQGTFDWEKHNRTQALKHFRIDVANGSKEALDLTEELFQLSWVGRDEYENAQRAYDDYTVQIGSIGSRWARGGPRQTQYFLLLLPIYSVRCNLCRTEFETIITLLTNKIRN
jgi:hypothetical protein